MMDQIYLFSFICAEIQR